MAQINPNIPLVLTSSLQVPDHINALVYGGSGTGKSIMSCRGGGTAIRLDSDNGSLSIASTSLIADSDKLNIHTLSIINDHPDAHIAYPIGALTAQSAILTIKREGGIGGVKPDFVVLDSITTLSQMTMDLTLFNNKRLGQQPTLQDWGGQVRLLLDIIQEALTLPCHFIAIAHAQFVKDEHTGRMWIRPMMTGKLSEQIALYFDEVYYTVVDQRGGKDAFMMHTKPSGLITAKSRLDLPSPVDTDINIPLKRWSQLKQQGMQKLQAALTTP